MSQKNYTTMHSTSTKTYCQKELQFQENVSFFSKFLGNKCFLYSSWDPDRFFSQNIIANTWRPLKRTLGFELHNKHLLFMGK